MKLLPEHSNIRFFCALKIFTPSDYTISHIYFFLRLNRLTNRGIAIDSLIQYNLMYHKFIHNCCVVILRNWLKMFQRFRPADGVDTINQIHCCHAVFIFIEQYLQIFLFLNDYSGKF